MRISTAIPNSMWIKMVWFMKYQIIIYEMKDKNGFIVVDWTTIVK